MNSTQHSTVGALIARVLENHGVELVFGIPGTHNLEIYRGIGDSAISHIVTRHEQGAAYGADGYARATGRPGVIVVTSGPGLTNALTGMATAYADSVPLLVLSPGVPIGEERLGLGSLHEMKDQRAAVDRVVERSIRPHTAEQLFAAINSTFARWATERGRPVHIEIPLDLLEESWEGRVPPPWPTPPRFAPAPEGVMPVVTALVTAHSPLLLVGGGAIDAAGEVTRLAKLLDAPVLSTPSGKGVLDEGDALAGGAFASSPLASPLIEDSDVVLALGTELRNFPAHFGGKLVRVDIDADQLHKNAVADLPLHADVGSTVSLLTSLINTASDRSGAARVTEFRRHVAAQLMSSDDSREPLQAALREVLAPDAIVCGDSSQVSYRGTGLFWKFPSPRQYLYPDGYATLGYALPAAIGAKLAYPARNVIALLGDGALMFSVQELMTAAEQGLSLPVIIVDNQGFAEIREGMIDREIEPFAVDLPSPDFELLARSMGCVSALVHNIVDCAAAVRTALAEPRPTVIIYRPNF